VVVVKSLSESTRAKAESLAARLQLPFVAGLNARLPEDQSPRYVLGVREDRIQLKGTDARHGTVYGNFIDGRNDFRRRYELVL
jgi:hypothetical protein